MKNKKRIDNNGFSLVELIIVIAIMAVLIGVLAPQYLKYVERGRESADLDNIDIIVHAVEIYNADPDHTPVTGSITGTSTGAVTVVGIDNALTDANLSTTINMKSKEYKSTWKISFIESGWTVDDESTNDKLATALGR